MGEAWGRSARTGGLSAGLALELRDFVHLAQLIEMSGEPALGASQIYYPNRKASWGGGVSAKRRSRRRARERARLKRW